MGTIFKNNQKALPFTDHKNNVFFKLSFGIHRYSKRSFYKSYCTVQLKHESPKLYLIENKLAYASNSSEERHMFSSKPKSLPCQNVGVTWLPVMKEPYDTRFWRISGFPSGAFSCHYAGMYGHLSAKHWQYRIIRYSVRDILGELLPWKLPIS
jgi:hypothetical protein